MDDKDKDLDSALDDLFGSDFIDSNRSCRSHESCNHRRRCGKNQGVFHGFQCISVPQQLCVPLQGETGKNGKTFS